MPSYDEASSLSYLDAEHVRSPAGALSELDVVTSSGEPVGTIAGVVIEASARRARYFDVRSNGSRRRHYLIEADHLVQVDSERKQLRLLRDEVPEVHHGAIGTFRPFSDEDLLAAMFAPRAA